MSEFQFKEIDGYLSLNEATENLVNIAKCIQSSHKEENAATYRKDMQLRVFEIRAAGIKDLMDLIQDYLEQIPDDLN
jgi:hypothetical protein